MHGISEPTEEEISRVIQDDPEDRELQKMEWPRSFIPLWDKQAEDGVRYLKKRHIEPGDGIYYDTNREGIVFPYYYDNACVGAQVRFIHPKKNDEKLWKITTIPGTKLGKLFYGWNQSQLPFNVKYLVITEGAFNAIALQQTFNRHYGGITKNPYRFVAASGSSMGKHRSETLRDQISDGKKVILAADPDQAGIKMLEECVREECITHYSTVSEDEVDWNDLLIRDGDEGLSEEFLKNLKRI